MNWTMEFGLKYVELNSPIGGTGLKVVCPWQSGRAELVGN